MEGSPFAGGDFDVWAELDERDFATSRPPDAREGSTEDKFGLRADPQDLLSGDPRLESGTSPWSIEDGLPTADASAPFAPASSASRAFWRTSAGLLPARLLLRRAAELQPQASCPEPRDPWLVVAERRYPRMRALVPPSEPPSSNVAKAPATVGPRPRTFFPAPHPPQRRVSAVREAAPQLEALLGLMAEGLLLGTDASGATLVQVTLRDEFFAGTELRVARSSGGISAVLVPPNRDTYDLLSAHRSELATRLAERGLKVLEVSIVRP